MHLYFYLRGIVNQVDLWKAMAQGQFWQWKRTNLKTKKEEIILVQGALRPSVMGAWEYVFPEECLADVLAVFGIKEGIGEIGAEVTFMNKAKLAGLRTIFGAKKIPKDALDKAAKISPSVMVNKSTRGLSGISVPGIAIHTIGIKEDKRRDTTWGYAQEML